MGRFINFTHHPSLSWSTEQLCAAEAFGEVEDIPFPDIPTTMTEEQMRTLADEYLHAMIERDPIAAAVSERQVGIMN